MPMYTYICKDCGEKFDLLIGVTSEEPKLKCKKCNSENIDRLLSGFSVGGSRGRSSSGSSCSTGTCPTCF
ncbi:MAG: zinc ribbon domain-containing protein [Candidatus Saelkia tenebricola]|nr:zinc ribbon domain-containing protein [Candidatus Saelkia tenebricola]